MSPSTTESICEAVREAHAALRQALDGMDYCLDWRPQPGEWSAREIVSHLLRHGHALNQAVRQALHGDTPTWEPPRGQPLLTPERREQEMAELLAEVDQSSIEALALLSSNVERQVLPEDSSCQPRLSGLVAAEYREHWPEHVRQLSQIRYSLGL